MKIDRHGQAEIMSREIYSKIRSNFIEPHHQLFFDIAFYTGERWGAICQLQVTDAYTERGKPRNSIIYRKATRKDNTTRELPIGEALRLRLGQYDLPNSAWLFPGDKPRSHITVRAMDAAYRRALDRAGLSGLGYSTHSTRRTFITALDRAGISLSVIQSLTGHKSLACLRRYIEVSDEQKIKAIEAI